MPASLARLIQTYPERVRRQALANAREAAALLDTKLKDTLGEPFPPASRPGEAPHRRTGRLQRESYAEAEARGDAIVITVASPTPYASYLAASGRVWLRTVIEENREQVEEILLRRGYGRLPQD